jgi:hypothetical protein
VSFSRARAQNIRITPAQHLNNHRVEIGGRVQLSSRHASGKGNRIRLAGQTSHFVYQRIA